MALDKAIIKSIIKEILLEDTTMFKDIIKEVLVENQVIVKNASTEKRNERIEKMISDDFDKYDETFKTLA